MKKRFMLSALLAAGLVGNVFAATEEVSYEELSNMSYEERQAYFESLSEEQKQKLQKEITAKQQQLENTKAKPAIEEDTILPQYAPELDQMQQDAEKASQ